MLVASVNGFTGIVKVLCCVLRRDRVFNHCSVRQKPTVKQAAIGKGDHPDSDVIVWMLHICLHTDFWLHESLAVDGNKTKRDSLKLAGRYCNTCRRNSPCLKGCVVPGASRCPD